MNAEQEKIEAAVKKACAEISEYVDTVRIFVTHSNAKNAGCWDAYSEGRGNFYAQLGQVGDWIERQRERTRINEISEDGADGN